MRLLQLLCLVGVCLASSPVEIRWQPSTEYVFEYQSRVLTGLPQLSLNSFTGVAFMCKVHVIPKSGVSGESTSFTMRIEEPLYAQVDKTRDNVGEMNIDPAYMNWRLLPVGPYLPIPLPQKEKLSKPWEARFNRDGSFEEISVGTNEPTWAINIKKAMTAMIQTKFYSGSSVQEKLQSIDNQLHMSSLKSGESDFPRSDEINNDNDVVTWTEEEEALDGKCKVTYQLNELPKFMIRDKPELIPNRDSCDVYGQSVRYFEIIKIRDVNTCSRRTSFSFYKPGHFNCDTGNCEGMWSRSSMTRYTACGKSRTNMHIQTIVNEGELLQNLLGFNSEKFLTGFQQKFDLSETRRGSSSGIETSGDNTKVLRSLYYEYNTNMLPNNRQYSEIQIEKLEKELINGFVQLVNNDLSLESNDEVGRRNIPMKALTLSKAVALLNVDQLNQVYNRVASELSQVERVSTFAKVFFDTLAMSGSTPAYELLIERIRVDKHISKAKIHLFLMNLPNSLLIPNKNILEKLFSLVEESSSKWSPYMHRHALLSFTVLVKKACLAENKDTSYPTWVYGQFCNSDSEIVTEKLMPYLRSKLSEPEMRDAVIIALGHLGNKEVLPLVLPFIDNSSEGRSYSSLTRMLAVFTISRVGKISPDIALPALHSVFFNRAEASEVRVAAFNAILSMYPSNSMLSAILSTVQVEKDLHVTDAVASAFYSMAEQESSEMTSPEMRSLRRRMSLLYPLIATSMRFRHKVPTTGTVFSGERLNKLGIGYESTMSWTASSRESPSILPSDVYTKLSYYLGRYAFSPVEIGLRFRDTDNILATIMDTVYGEEIESEQGEYPVHEQWRNVIRHLNIGAERREESEDSNEGSIFMNVFESTPIFAKFHLTRGVRGLRNELEKMLSRSSRVCGETEFNMEQVLNMSPTDITIPSDIGFPIAIEFNLPAVLSLRGRVNVDCSSPVPTLKVKADGFMSAQYNGYVGTFCPFREELVVVGVDETAAVNVPADFDINVNLSEKKLNIKMKSPSHWTSEKDVLHYSVQPYTMSKSVYDMSAPNLAPNMRPIVSPTDADKKTLHFGNMFGLDLTTTIESESRFLDIRTAIEKFSWYNWNPFNLFRFVFVNPAVSEQGKPSIRKHKMTVKYNPTSSETKEIELQLQVSAVSKQGMEFEVQEHHLESGFRKRPVSGEKALGLKALLESASVDLGAGLHTRFSTLFKSSSGRSRAMTYSIDMIAGRSGSVKSKWNVNLRKESSADFGWGPKAVCIEGEVTSPIVPLWNLDDIRRSNVEFKYRNNIGFGNDCSESKIVATGTSETSDEQKEYSKVSREAMQLRQLMKTGSNMTEMSEEADEIRRQAATLDRVDFTVKYINVPEKLLTGSNFVIKMLKAIWWPHIAHEGRILETNEQMEQAEGQASRYQQQQFGDKVSITRNWNFRFSPVSPTFDLVISKDGDKSNAVVFRNVRLPYPTSYFFPLNALETPMRVVARKLTGESFSPVCKLENDIIRTFDSRESRAELDDCFHLLSADCTERKRFAVLARTVERDSKKKETKIFIGETSVLIKPTESHSKTYSNLEVFVNSERKQMVRGSSVEVRNRNGAFVAELHESLDGVIELRSRFVKVETDAFNIKVKPTSMLKGKLCGLCGNQNGHSKAVTMSPRGCLFSKPELALLAYRADVSDLGGRCGPVEQSLRRELEEEKRQCIKYEDIPTKLSESYRAQNGECVRHKHEVIEKSSELCISRVPVIECGRDCQPTERVEKRISFTCMEKNRTGWMYAERARRGEAIPELFNMPESFVSKINLPKSCAQVRL